PRRSAELELMRRGTAEAAQAERDTLRAEINDLTRQRADITTYLNELRGVLAGPAAAVPASSALAAGAGAAEATSAEPTSTETTSAEPTSTETTSAEPTSTETASPDAVSVGAGEEDVPHDAPNEDPAPAGGTEVHDEQDPASAVPELTEQADDTEPLDGPG